jgi:hypothetical protein
MCSDKRICVGSSFLGPELMYSDFSHTDLHQLPGRHDGTEPAQGRRSRPLTLENPVRTSLQTLQLGASIVILAVGSGACLLIDDLTIRGAGSGGAASSSKGGETISVGSTNIVVVTSSGSGPGPSTSPSSTSTGIVSDGTCTGGQQDGDCVSGEKCGVCQDCAMGTIDCGGGSCSTSNPAADCSLNIACTCSACKNISICNICINDTVCNYKLEGCLCPDCVNDTLCQ